MTKEDRTRRTLRLLSLGAGLLLPTLTLVPLGSLWLWQRGWLIYWAIAATLLVFIAFFVQQRLFPKRAVAEAIRSEDGGNPVEDVNPNWSPLETAAWSDVQALARKTDPQRLTKQQEAIQVALDTIEAVARRIHPEVSEALWQFTVPEAFAVLERVSARLGSFSYDNIPLSDRLTVGQALALYRWRGTIESFEKAYGLWRIVRLANPLSAATGEIREQLTKQMLQWSREQVMRQLTDAYVREVGRAAIDLYGGRLAVGREALEAHVSSASKADLAGAAAEVAEPLRIMVAGQTSAGKSSLINALAGEMRAAVDALPATARFVPYELTHAGLPAALIIDSPGLEPASDVVDELIRRSMECDLVLWVAAANSADRQLDEQAITTFRKRFAASPNRRRPPMLLALTNIDRLRPFGNWSPPYDFDKPSEPKASSVAAAMAAVRADLGFGAAETVPVALPPGREAYNVDTLWQRIVETIPEAQRAQLLRRIQDLKTDGRWSRLWSQTVNAGRVIGQSLQR